MKTIKLKDKGILLFSKITMLFCFLCILSSCDKDMEGELFQISDELMLDELIEKNEDLSMFLEVIDKSGIRGTVHAYGTYTLFAPNNAALSAYFSKEKITIDNLTQDEAAEILKYHLITDTLATADFIDGRLSSTNFLNKYITTRTQSDDILGVYIEVNRQARILEKDVRGANGYLHVVDNVLTAPETSITDVIKSLSPIQYRLMKEFYDKSKFADVIDKEGNTKWYTFFIQDDDAFAAAGITSYEELITRLKEKTPDIANEDTLLYNYIAYHCSPKLYYVADLLTSSILETMVPAQRISVKREQDKVILNEFNIGGVKEDGVYLDRANEYSDLSCANGVVHKIDGNIEIVKRSAYRIYWDMAEQPEIMALKGFRKAGTQAYFSSDALSEMSWGGKLPTTIEYYCSGYPSVVNKDNAYVYGDRLNIRLDTNTNSWFEFKTPFLVKARYKVWICFRRVNAMDFKVIYKEEGQDDQNVGNARFDYLNGPGSYGMTETDDAYDKRLELDGQKRWVAKMFDTANPAVLLGIIDVQSDGRHTIRLEALKQAQHTPALDMVHFIPLEEDQLWPRVDSRGTWIYPETPNCQIWPYSECEPEGGDEDNE